MRETSTMKAPTTSADCVVGDVDDLDAHHVVPVSPVHNLVRKDASVSPVEVGDDHGLSPNGYIPELVVLDSCVGPHPQDMIISVGAVIIVGDIVVAEVVVLVAQHADARTGNRGA